MVSRKDRHDRKGSNKQIFANLRVLCETEKMDKNDFSEGKAPEELNIGRKGIDSRKEVQSGIHQLIEFSLRRKSDDTKRASISYAKTILYN